MSVEAMMVITACVTSLIVIGLASRAGRHDPSKLRLIDDTRVEPNDEG